MAMNASDTTTHPSRWRRWTAWALALWAAVWLLGWLGLPPLLRWQMQAQLEQRLERPVAVEAVRFRPWSMEMEVLGLSIGQPITEAPDSAGPTLRVQRLYANAELQSLLRWAPVVDALAIQGLEIQVRHRGEGRYDIDDLLARLASPDDTPDPSLPRFAVFNISLEAPALTLVDEPVGVTHRILDLNLQVPFLSNLGARREVATEPRLSLLLNGQRLESQALSTPFAQTHATEATLRIPALDLAPYLPYWPAAWPMRPQQGVLDVDLRLAFEQQDAPQINLQGRLGVTGLQIAETRGGQAEPLFHLPRLTLALEPSQPLMQRWHVGEVFLQGPELWVRRNAQGQINWQSLAEAWPANHSADAPSAADRPLRFRLDHLHWQDAQVHWDDASTRPAARWTWTAMQHDWRAFQWPLEAPAPFEGQLVWEGAELKWQGALQPEGLTLQTTLADWPLATIAPYLSTVLKPALSGALTVASEMEWSAAPEGGLTVSVPQLAVSDIRLGPTRAPLARLQRLEVADADLRWPDARLNIGRVTLQGPQVGVSRDAEGRWMTETWLADPPATRRGPAAQSTATGPAWDVRLQAVQVRQGRLDWTDALPTEPVNLRLDALRLDLRNLQPLARRQASMPLTLDAQLLGLDAQGRPRTDRDAGQLNLKGEVRLPSAHGGGATPMRLDMQLQAERLPLHELVAYAGPALQLDVLRADASARGRLSVDMGTDLALRYEGDAAIDDFSADSLQPQARLLDWKSLALRGIDLKLAPDAPLRLQVGETVLSDYYARVLVSETGRLNLQDLWKPDARDKTEPPTGSAASPPPDIRFGPMSLVQGQVDFADRFIRPNYSARLTELTGSLSAFLTQPGGATEGDLSALTLRGRVEGTATLDITGQLNPLAQPLMLDIRGQVRELELPPLSPYSTRYAGHGIERGKLSMDVRYQVAADGQLQASNQIILNQLRFGDRDASSEAPNLPVKLAVALLADRNGVIDINLPIGGSLNDPQFRLGPIIVKVIFNLITKAVTAPFSLLASALSGGSDELSTLNFALGQPALDATAGERLQRVAKALQDRPALAVTVVGHAHPEAERDAYRRAQLDERIRAEKRRLLARQGISLDAAQGISPEEYPSLLKAVYQRTDIPKPRNLIGMAKDIPQADMETLLLTAIPVPEDAMRNLALARAVQVKDALVAQGVEASRVFLGAPQIHTQASEATPARAELQLGTR